MRPLEIGGGENFRHKTCGEDADIVVDGSADLEELNNILDGASSGDKVFLESDVEIDMGFDEDGVTVTVPENVTLASDRGCNGSSGALLIGGEKPGTEWVGSRAIAMKADSKIAGLRFEGPAPDREMNWMGEEFDYTDGIEGRGENVVVENNELYGWPTAAVRGGSDPIEVRHNYIHSNNQRGLGYGVSTVDWPSVIEYNRFERNRHAVAGSGEEGEGYIVRYNTFGGEGIAGAGHKIDMHGDNGDGGSKIEVYRNTVKYPDSQAVYLRGEPVDYAEIRDNWFYNDNEYCLSDEAGGSGYCSVRLTASDWSSVDLSGNHLGRSEPGCGVGAPRLECVE